MIAARDHLSGGRRLGEPFGVRDVAHHAVVNIEHRTGLRLA